MVTIRGQMREAAMTPHEIAREHISWCRNQGHSPSRVLRSLDAPLPRGRCANWSDAIEAVEWVSRRDMFENFVK